jgi:hypothetical protein
VWVRRVGGAAGVREGGAAAGAYPTALRLHADLPGHHGSRRSPAAPLAFTLVRGVRGRALEGPIVGFPPVAPAGRHVTQVTGEEGGGRK